ncbi:THAP domain-containing protein 5-like isoform X1 [Coregonus clupeaformis]|uniref:THAP domain-containing protein 5-like isoform X1 n=1 Tax=Coregonus clupeaformis TaxID=59861 RepID=UPI001E1C3F29|nr:THAP domain-containing protein 5-like isoform X1 [Coregonus clupeaformis]
MPRYCAVKLCKNRGGTPSKENKRLSFYPFPLQDEARLQIWVDNMKREEWTPSRHQYLCSEHFTEDCFDLRWGIRYLKHTAIPTVFPHRHDDEEKTVSTSKKNTKPKTRICDANIELIRSPSPPGKNKPLILRRRVRVEPVVVSVPPVPNPEDASESTVTTLLYERQLVSDAEASTPSEMVLGEVMLSETQAAVCEVSGELPGDSGGILTASCLNLSAETQTLQQLDTLDSTVTVLCCESVGPVGHFSECEATVDALQAVLGQTFRIFPLELRREEGVGDGEEGPGEGEHISVYEHSYSKQDTDKEQLWSKIASLHTKIMELDRREESTMGKIRSLESEMAHLKKNKNFCKEKQKVLEDYITSALL